MGALDYLFQQQTPSSVTSNIASSNGLPDWYQEYLRGVAGKATQIAGAQANTDIPALSVAGFNPDQTQAFGQVRANQGAWQPNISAATGIASNIQPNAQALIGQGMSAVQGGTPTWDSTQAAKYMSPYTEGVINNIQRLGLRNFNENLMPGIQDSMLGSGQFGSTRNADIIGRTARDVNADITGQTAQALQQGYTNAQTMFTSDAQRQQAQQALQAGTALQGAGASTSAGNTAATQLGALGQATSALGLSDAQQMGAIGQQEQGLQQEGLNAGYQNANTAMNFDWSTLNNMNSVLRGMQLPQTVTQTANAPLPGANFGSAPISQIGGALSTLTPR